jgi:hypothetical protein
MPSEALPQTASLGTAFALPRSAGRAVLTGEDFIQMSRIRTAKTAGEALSQTTSLVHSVGFAPLRGARDDWSVLS